MRRAFAPLAPVLAEIPRRAWDRFLALPDAVPLAEPRTRANIVSSFMVDEAIHRLLPLPNVQPIPNHTGTLFLIDDHYVVRFKYVDEKGLSSNYPTDRALDFNDPQASLDGIPAKAIRLDCGYKLNDVETQVTEVCLVRRSKKRVLFSIQLDQAPAVVALPIQLTLDAEAPAPAIRARGSRNQKNKKSNDT